MMNRSAKSLCPPLFSVPMQKNYIPGWVSLDANFMRAKIDLWTRFWFRFLVDALVYEDRQTPTLKS